MAKCGWFAPIFFSFSVLYALLLENKQLLLQ